MIREASGKQHRVGVPLSDKDLHAVASRLDKNKKGVISYGLLSHGVRSHIREERKEDKRLEVRKRNRLDERRRILQTELPEIYKRNYEDDMSMFYASQSSTTFSSPLRSATGSTASLAGSQVPILPPIEMSRSSFRSRQESVEPKGNELQNGLEPPQALQMSASTRRMSSSQGRMKKSYKLMKFVNAYLDRKKSIANIDMSLLHIPKLET